MRGPLTGLNQINMLRVASLSLAMLLISVSGCMKGAKTVAGARGGSNFKAIPGELKTSYPPNQNITRITFTIKSNEGSPISGVSTDFRAFDVTAADQAKVSPEKMRAEMMAKWNDGNYIMNADGVIASTVCDAGFTRDVCTGNLAGPTSVTNQKGEASVGFTTPNAPGGTIAVAVRVPQDTTAGDLIEFVLIRITPNDDFANSGISPLQSALIVIPMLFNDDGDPVIKAGVGFNLLVYAPGIPNTEVGKGFSFDFDTTGSTEPVDGESVILPIGTKRCDFRNGQCIVPGGPFKVLKPTTLTFNAKATDPKFPVKPTTITRPVITGAASQLILSLTEVARGINNACIGQLDITKPCLDISADQDLQDLYPMLIDEGGNFVANADTTWEVTGPLLGRLKNGTTITGKQSLLPLGAGQGILTVRLTNKPSIYTSVRYIIRSGVPESLTVTSEHTIGSASAERATVPFGAKVQLFDKKGNQCIDYTGQLRLELTLQNMPVATNKFFLPADVDADTDKITMPNHGYTDGVAVQMTSSLTLPGGVKPFTRYYVIVDNVNTIRLATTADNATSKTNIDLTGPGTGSLVVDASVPLGLTNMIKPVSVIDYMTTPLEIANGVGQTSSSFLVTKVPNSVAGEQLPQIILSKSETALRIRDPQAIVITAGPATQSLLRNASNGNGAIWKSLANDDAPLGYGLATDQQYYLYNAGYDAAGNYVGEVPSYFWGVHYTLDDKNPVASGYNAALSAFASLDPSQFNLISSCPNPDVMSKPGVSDHTNQPVSNNLYCGMHRGLGAKAGTNTVYNSAGVPGTGRILAIPMSSMIRPNLTSLLTITSGTATKFVFEFRDAATGTTLSKPELDVPIEAGLPFKIYIHAQDAQSIDSAGYTGVKDFDVVSYGGKSWLGFSANLPNGNLSCEFGITAPGICVFPGTYTLADVRSLALMSIKQTTPGGVTGEFVKQLKAKKSAEARIVFADKKGLGVNSYGAPTSEALPLTPTTTGNGNWLWVTADADLGFGVVLTDMIGNYLRDVTTADGLVYEGFASEGPDLTGVFDPVIGSWLGSQSSAWNASYQVSNLFTEVVSQDSKLATPRKFYDPSVTADQIQLRNISNDATKFSTVLVPQNRFGKGFAVARSSLPNSTLIGFPSPLIIVQPGKPEHIETILSGTLDPVTGNYTNTVTAGMQCHDLKIILHDRKHNQVTSFTYVVDNVALKLVRANSANPGGLPDPHAMDYSFMTNTDNNQFYRSISHGSFSDGVMQGPFRDGFFLAGATDADKGNSGGQSFGGEYSFFGGHDSPLADWWIGKVNIISGEISFPGQVCLYNGQDTSNYNGAEPFLDKFLQVDIKQFSSPDGSVNLDSDFTSRGAGIKYAGMNGALVGSDALTGHAHPDKFTVKRGLKHHLHPTFSDDLNGSGLVSNIMNLLAKNRTNNRDYYLGVMDRCAAPHCGTNNVYWHLHDESHNFIKPASATGFQTSGNISNAVGPAGALGSPSTTVFPSGQSRNVATLNGPASIYASNNEIQSIATCDGTLDFRCGYQFPVLIGPVDHMRVERAGAPTLSPDDPFGLVISVYDYYDNPTGGNVGFLGSQAVNVSNLGIDRTLSAYWNEDPLPAPNDATLTPILFGVQGGSHKQWSDRVSTPVKGVGFLGQVPSLITRISELDSATLSRIYNTGQDLVLNLTLTDNEMIPFCQTAGNCKSTGVQTVTKSIALSSVAGAQTATGITNSASITATEYLTSNYDGMFNTLPVVAGQIYPFGPDNNRIIKTYACAKDAYGNLGDCAGPASFSFVSTSDPTVAVSTGATSGQAFFSWYPKKPGTFKIQAVKNGKTGISDELAIGSLPLAKFIVDNVTPAYSEAGASVNVGDELKVKVCMADQNWNIISAPVYADGNLVTDPQASLTMNFSTSTINANEEGKNIAFSTATGADFDASSFPLGPSTIKFTDGCAYLYAKVWAAAIYSNAPLMTLSYVDTLQKNRVVSGGGFNVKEVKEGLFHHYRTIISNVPPGKKDNALVPAWSNLGATNISVLNGGNRFDLTIYARDFYGNNVKDYSNNFTLKLKTQYGNIYPEWKLSCAAPANDKICLNQSISPSPNGASVIVRNLALDIPGNYLIMAENADGTGFESNSDVLSAVSSIKSVKEYRVSAPDKSSVLPPGHGMSVYATVAAVDNSGAPVGGIDSILNALSFTWLDGAGQSLSSHSTSKCSPVLPTPYFKDGTATYDMNNQVMHLVKAETVALNIKDNQVQPLQSNNTKQTLVETTGLNYEISCTKFDGSSCSGTQATPSVMNATSEEPFSLKIKVFDVCQNSAMGPVQLVLKGRAVSGVGFAGGTPPLRLLSGSTSGTDGYGTIYVPMNGQTEVTVDKVYYHVANQTLTFDIIPAADNIFTNLIAPYHTYNPTLNTVKAYKLNELASQTVNVGQKMTFKLQALDDGGNVITGIDNLLRTQTYSWNGGVAGPNGELPDYPPIAGGVAPSGLDFTNGSTSTIGVTFKKAEQILDFYVMDNFVPAASGVGGFGPTGQRRSGGGIYNLPIMVTQGLPNEFVLSATSTTHKAGVGFDVTVTAFDKYKNLVTGLGSDTLAFSWAGASSSVANSINLTAKPAEVLATGSREFNSGTGSFTTTGAPFILYRSNATVLAPQETPTLTVTGAKTGSQTATGQQLTASLSFTVQPNDTIAYTRISTDSVYSTATDFHNQALTITTDQTKSFFAHLFDPWGNYKGTSPSTAWTGTGSVAGRLAPTPSVTTTLTPTITGPGVITADCSAVAAGCLPDSTGTISVNPSPLVSFGVEQISHLEGANLTAGDQMQLKVCMLDKNGQKITSLVQNGTTTVTDPDATLNISASFINISLNDENNTLALSTDKDANFVTKAFGEGAKQLKFTQGCFDLYAKVLKSGTYGVTAPLLQLSHVDTLQNNISVGGAGIKVGTVAAGPLDHYVTRADLFSAPTPYHVPAWASPGLENQPATSGGNRFSVSVSARDLYGNSVAVNKTVNLSLVASDGVTAAASQIKCAAPNNDTSCLQFSLSNSSSTSIANMAVDIGGVFYIAATDGTVGFSKSKSKGFTADTSKLTVKQYVLTSPTSAIAGQNISIKVEPKDVAGNNVQGADTELNNLNFTWIDGSGVSLATGHVSPAPSNSPPILVGPKLNFAGGTTTVNLALTKAETGLKINIKDDQTVPVTSTNNTLTTVTSGLSLYYAINCTKVTGGGDCSGVSPANAASLNASPSDQFNLTLKAFDQYQNPKTDGASLPAIAVTYESGVATLPGRLEQASVATPTDTNLKFQLLVPMNGVSQFTVPSLFHRAGAHVLSYMVDPTSTSYVGMSAKTYHSYDKHIDMVYRYVTSGLSSPVTAGVQLNYSLQALDRAGNIVQGLDTQLNAQKFIWSGPTAAPNGALASLPGLTSAPGSTLNFINGSVAINSTFRNAESMNFSVTDDYLAPTTGVGAGIGGLGLGGRRIVEPYVISVSHATPTKYVISTDTTTVQAGSAFDVKVTALDQFNNPAISWLDDYLTFSWNNTASPSIANPKTSSASTAGVYPQGLRSFDTTKAQFSTNTAQFLLYRSNADALTPQEQPVLTVTGQTPAAGNNPLTGSLTFTVQPSSSYGYVKIASSATMDATTSLSGKPFSMSTNETKNLYAHLYDPWGNYRGNSAAVSWTGTGQIAGKFSPTSASTTTLTANTVGNGYISADCSGLGAGCVTDSSGLVSVGASPLKDFVVEHASTPAEGASVQAGQEIPMRVCMLDKAGQRITTDVYVDGVKKTEATGPIDIPVTFAGLNILGTVENKSIDLSKSTDANFAANTFPLGLVSLSFTAGCANFYAKLYATATYNSAPLLQVFHSATLQGGISVAGGGLKVTAVNPLGLDHFRVMPTRLSSSPQANSTQAWAVPGGNTYADANGNRFDVDVWPLDLHGNRVSVANQAVTLSAVGSDKVTALPRKLICASPLNNQACLTTTFSGNATTFSNLAVDTGGFIFYPIATSGSVLTSPINNNVYAAASAKTVDKYVVSAPSSVSAGSAFNVTIAAVDKAGNNVTGADTELRNLNLTWQDGQATPALLSTHTAPGGQAPTGVSTGKLTFNSGSATASLMLTKAETELKINVKDDQATPVASSTTATTNVGVGGQTWYAVTCTRVSDASDCTGASGSAKPMTSSANDKFNLTLQSYDQYKNVKVITASPQVSVARISGASSTGSLEQHPLTATRSNSNNQLIIPLTQASQGQASLNYLFVRSAAQAVSYQVDPTSATYDGMFTSTYHSYTPTIDSVYGYQVNSLPSSVAAGAPMTVSIAAVDRAGNAIAGIAAGLNAQTYTWSGAGTAPNNQAPVYPTPMTFDSDGRITNKILTLFKAETLAANTLIVKDDYNGTGGNGGLNGAAYRQSFQWSPLVVNHAAPSQYVMTAPSTTPFAGTAFDVTVKVLDQYLNPATSWTSDNLAFSWSGASSSISNPKISAVQTPGKPAAGTGTFAAGVFSTLTSPFVLYSANPSAASPQETATLTVTGSTSAGTLNNAALSTTLSFTTQPAAAIGYVKITKTQTYSLADVMTNVALPLTNDQTQNLFAHAFDAYGNYKNSSTNVTWSADGQLNGNLSPTSGTFTTVSPVSTGSGKVTANCSTAIPDCIDDMTGDIGVSSAPLNSFAIRHVSPSVAGATVNVGDEIPLEVCMLDTKNQKITSAVISNGLTITDPNALLSVTFSTTGSITNTSEGAGIQLSTGTGTGANSFTSKAFALGSQSLQFAGGCAPFYAKVYKAGTYNSSSLLSVLYSDTVQSKIISGSGLKLTAANAGNLDHYVTSVGGLGGGSTTQAWAVPGSTDTAASSNGNRFSVTVYARDFYGNDISVSGKSLTLSLLKQDGTSASRNLICSATMSNGTTCLNPSLNSNNTSVYNLAVDIGGQSFYVGATDGSATTKLASSTLINALASRKTVKQYNISAPATAVAGIIAPVTVTAVDISGAVISTADSDLNSALNAGGLVFTWTDGTNDLSTHTVNANAPITAPPTFVFGSASVNLTFVKSETLTVNIKDNQSPAVASSNASNTVVSAGTSLMYSIACAKVSNSANCTGTSLTPATLIASPTDLFNLTIQAYDQYKNPKASGETTPVVSLSYLSGLADQAGYVEQTPVSAQLYANQPIVNTNNSSPVTINNLYHRGGNHTVQFGMGSSSNIGYFDAVYHTYTAHKDMVYSYAMSSSIPANVTAGAPQSFTITARDRFGNAAKNIDPDLKAQAYSWFGATGSPVYPSTASNVINFTNGQSDSLSVTFKKTETAGFYVQDNYSPSVAGIGGVGANNTRRSSSKSVIVKNALADVFAMTSATTNPKAGAGFDVTVQAKDVYGNIVTDYPSDNMTFSWNNTASPSVTTVRNPTTTFSAASLGSVTMTSGSYSSSGGQFKIYRSNEMPTLTVTGTNTGNTRSAALSTTLRFGETQPSDSHGYVKMTTAYTYSLASELGTIAREITTDQTLTLYAHMFDEYGNYKGNSYNVVWSGSDALNGKLTSPGAVSAMTPTTQGTGVVTATCTGLTALCAPDNSGIYTVKPGNINKLVWQSPTPATIAQNTETCQQLTLQAQDLSNNAVIVSAATGITFTSSGGDGEFFASATECSASQGGGATAAIDSGIYHTTALAGSNGSRTANILAGQSTVSVWYANRVATATNGATVTATIGSLTNSRQGQITAGPTKRFAITSSAFSINAFGGADTPTCGAVTYKFQDTWGNDTPTTSSSTINLTSSSPNNTGSFYTDAACASLITSGTRTVASGAATDTVYYKDTQANAATLTLPVSSTLSGNAAKAAQTVVATVNPGTFAITSPAANSSVKDVTNPTTGPAFSWGSSLGARDYTVTYGTSTSCGTSIAAANTTGTANLPGGLNGLYFVCVRANGYSGTAPGMPQRTASTDATYKLLIDNAAPTGAITIPAAGITYIGPVTAATHTGAANTTVFQGTAADTSAGVNKVEVALQRTSDSKYWTGSAWGTTTATWLQASGTTAWTYAVADANFTDGSAYTLTARVTDNSLNPSTATITKGLNWKSSATSATIASGMPSSYSSWTTLGTPNPGVQVSSTGALVTTYSYQIVSGATCPTTGYPGTWTPVATKITDSISSRGDGQYTLCVIGRDEAENVQVSATPSSWYKDTQAPNITAMASQTVNSAYAVNPTVTDNIDALASLTYAWTFVSSASNRCTGASFSQSNIRNPSISATGCTNSWGAVTVRLTVTDRALNSANSDLTINWDQQPAYVSAITSTLTAGTSWKALSAIPVKISFTKDTGNFNRSSFNIVVSGSPTMTLNVLSTGGGAARTAALTAGTYTNNGSGVVTIDASYTVQAGDADQFAAGVVLNAAATTPFSSASTVVDNTGTPGTAIANANATTGSTALSNANIRIDTVAPTSAVTLSGPVATGYVNLSNSTSTTALSGAATGVNETTLSSTSLPAYKVITKGGTCSAATTGMSSTVPSPSTASMNTITEATYVICIKVTDPAGNDGYSVSGDIVLDRTPPVFTSMALANEANDGRINNTEQSSALAVASAAVSSGADATSNAVMYTVTQLTDCSAASGYATTIPAVSAMNTDGTWYVCVRLTDKATNIIYGQSSSITRQTTSAVIVSTSFQWNGDAADFFLNSTEKTTNTSAAILSEAQADKVGSTFKYAFGLAASTTCNSSLTYSLSVVPTKASFTADGVYRACVEITDTVGNKSWYTTQNPTTNTLTVDTVLPSLTFTLANAAATDGYINAAENSDANALALATESSPSTDLVASTKRYKVIAFTTSCDFMSVGSSAQITIPKANSTDFGLESDYKICLMAQDTAGNIGYGSSAKIILDITAPTVGTYALANDALGGYINDSKKNNTTAIVSYTGGNGTSIDYQVTQSATTDAGCASLTAASYSSTVPKSNSLGNEGTYRVCARVGDLALNYSYKISANIIKDITAPNRSTGFDWQNGASDGYLSAAEKTAALSILTSIVTSDGTVDYALGTTASCSAMTGYSSTAITMASVGVDNTAYRACARMTDAAGNVAYYPPTTTLNVDTSTPTFSFTTTQPTNRSKVVTLNIQATSTTTSALVTAKTDTDTYKYYYKVISGASADCGTVGTWSTAVLYNVATTGVSVSNNLNYPEGNVTICAKAEDGAGNQSTVVAAQWIKDVTLPAAFTLTAPTGLQNSMTPTVTWTTPAWVTGGSPADTHTIELYVATESTCAVGNRKYSNAVITGVASTTQNQTISGITTDGKYYICMYVSDLAGNKTGPITGSFEVETDTVHVSWTDSAGVNYGRKDNIGNFAGTNIASGSTYMSRTSLAINSSNFAGVSYQQVNGANSAMLFKQASAGGWGAEISPITSSNSSLVVGAFNEIAYNGDDVNLSFRGFNGANLRLMGYAFEARKDNNLNFNEGNMGVITDTSTTIATDTTQYALVATSTNLYLTEFGSTPRIVNRPSGCSRAVYTSTMFKSGSIFGAAIACVMSDNSCKVHFAEITFNTTSMAPSWQEIGTIMSSGCSIGALTEADKPSLVIDRISSGTPWSALWVNRSTATHQLIRWSQEIPTGTSATRTEVVQTGTSLSYPSIAVDRIGRSYVLYKDGTSVIMKTNNSRDNSQTIGGWSGATSTYTIPATTGVTGVGSIGITGMRGRSNTSGN